MITSEQTNEIFAALAKCQGSMKPAAFDAKNPHFKSRYSSLSSIWDAIRGPLADNGLSVLQDVSGDGTFVGVATRICHSSGQWVQFSTLTIRPGKTDAHGIGSSATYCKRYSLAAAMGVVSDEDDDGNASVVPMSSPTPIPCITRDQVAEIAEGAARLGQSGTDIIMKTLDHFDIKNLNQLPAVAYDKVMKRLKDESQDKTN